jgi:class 3 adenylate cyclase/tetratricopeptide (TPR) repeat protein
MTLATSASGALDVYVPRLSVAWLDIAPDEQVRSIDGSLAFVDISGFTKLTERLARRGRVGAEEMSDILDATFGTLLSVARADGAELVKWGGDAVLLLFDGDDHAARAARSAFRMRKTLREFSKRRTSAGAISLRMSVGIHSGLHHFFLVGDPAVHRELIVSGPAASITAEMEAAASAGEIVVSEATAALLHPRLVGAPVGEGRLLRAEPQLEDVPVQPRTASDADVALLLPPMIRDYVRVESGDSEHRPIAVAFVQFSGTDAVLLDGGPAALAEALDQCIRNVQHATNAHQVTFFESDINRDGGKIMLTAGAPRTAGSDEDRMLRTVRQIVDNAGTLSLRVGVNRGYVFAGQFGPDFRRTYSVKGDAINLAARVMGKAAPGEVLATREVMGRARTKFEVEPLPPFMVKGKAKPVDAVRLGAIVGGAAEGPSEGPFVGRADTMATLTADVAAARNGSGVVIDVVGGPGIGKSRLVGELVARNDDLVVVAGRSDAYESNTAYLPFRGLLDEALALRYADESDESSEGAVEDRLRRLGDESAQLTPWLPLLGVVLDVPIEDTTETHELDEQFRKAKLEEIVVEALGVLLPSPTFLLFDDAHFMDDASADVLRRLEEETARRPWVVLATRREQATGYQPTGGSPAYRRIGLGPLDTEAGIELIAAVTRGAPLTRPAMQALAARAGGNPLFLSSLSLIAGRSGSLSDLPESIEGVVASEIDRLDPVDRSILRYAAVLGMHFTEEDLRDLLADRAYPVDESAAMRLSEFLEEEGTGELSFRHALVRDVAYAGLPFRLRREMHERVGLTIEARLATPDSESELLSLHFFHAGSYDKAWTYSRVAGERAHSRYAYHEAGEFFERAIESAKRAGAMAPHEVAAVFERLGDVRTLEGASREAITAYRGGRRQLRDAPIASADLRYKEAILSQRLGKFAQSLTLISQGMREVAGLDDPGAATVRAKLATRYGFARYLQGRSREAIRWCRLGVTEASKGTDKCALAMAYNALELAYLHSDEEPDRPYGQLAMQTYEEADDLSGQGLSANTLAIAAHNAGRWAEAEQLFAQAADIFGRLGDVTNESNAIYNRADLLLRQGRFVDAEPPLREVIATARAVDDEELVSLALRELARAYSGMGKHVDAAGLLENADGRLAALGLRHEVAILRAASADAALRAGNPDGAIGLVDEALALAREVGNAQVVPALHRVRASALLELGALDEAATSIERGLAATGGADGYDRALLQLTAARLAESRGEDATALRDEALLVLQSLGVDPAVA